MPPITSNSRTFSGFFYLGTLSKLTKVYSGYMVTLYSGNIGNPPFFDNGLSNSMYPSILAG
jgi:hypothetical protein